jgi:glycosyltransferase involved in cell wall biosynthesis
VAANLAAAEVVVMQWNRRGWGRHGRSLVRLLRFRRAYRGALVVTLHDIFERQGLRQRWLQPEAWSLRYLGRVADRVVVHSEVEVERLGGLVPPERIAVVPHFVERRELALGPAEARQRLGLAGRRLVTLLGFVYGRKGHRYAVEAVPDLPDDVVMVYAGGPVAGRSFVYDLALSKARELGLGHRFRITGYLSEDDLETWIAATHLAILPFTDLSASGSLSSWIAAGKPMLVSDLPGFREYERRVPGALRFFAPTEPGPLAAAIRDVLEAPLPDPDPAVLRLAAELGMERTVDRYLAVARDALAAR